MFIRFDRMYERDRHTDGQTDRQTPHDDIGRACIASRGKNRPIVDYNVNVKVKQELSYRIHPSIHLGFQESRDGFFEKPMCDFLLVVNRHCGIKLLSF